MESRVKVTDTQKAQASVHMSAALKQELQDLADAGYRNLSQQIILLIELGLKEQKKNLQN